jgi:hypothetical protein
MGRNNSINVASMKDISLHMGFINTPYTAEAMEAPVRASKLEEKRKRRRGFSRTMTADKLSKILERKYGIVETFSEVYEEEIHSLINNGFREIAERMIQNRGGETRAKIKNLMKPYTDQVQSMFKTFIDDEEMNGMVPGVPTDASKGKRRKRGISTRQRPSFSRTGIYKASFRAWVK